MRKSRTFQGNRGKKAFLVNRFYAILALWLNLLLFANLSAQDCNGTHTGLIPLTDLGTGTYSGSEGGLYPGGSSEMPEQHMAAGLALAQQIQPLNAAGQPDSNGKIVLVSIGMSNAEQEFNKFLEIVAAESGLNPNLVVVNGAKASQDASKWSIANGQAWSNFAGRLADAGVTALQVQAVWIKNAMPAGLNTGDPFGPQTFPERAQWLKDFMKAGVLNLKAAYPNVRLAYLASRIYAGYATTPLSPEPFAYQGGFAMKWLIEEQINGDPELAFEGPTAAAPWLAWGPYLWADGLGSDGVVGGVPGRNDGLEWECGDYQDDGTHPGPFTGAPKVGQILMDFFMSDPTANIWFTSNPTSVQISSFTAQSHNTDVILRWVTSGEINNAGFEIQRKGGGRNFETVKFIAGQGTAFAYEFIDKRLQPGEYSYRLQQIDLDGTVSYSPEVIVQIGLPEEFKLEANYPNPFRQSTTLFFRQPVRSSIGIRIYNLLGQEVTRFISVERNAGMHTIQWNGLNSRQQPVPPGVYFVTLWNREGQKGEKLVGQQKIIHIR